MAEKFRCVVCDSPVENRALSRRVCSTDCWHVRADIQAAKSLMKKTPKRKVFWDRFQELKKRPASLFNLNPQRLILIDRYREEFDFTVEQTVSQFPWRLRPVARRAVLAAESLRDLMDEYYAKNLAFIEDEIQEK